MLPQHSRALSCIFIIRAKRMQQQHLPWILIGFLMANASFMFSFHFCFWGSEQKIDVTHFLFLIENASALTCSTFSKRVTLHAIAAFIKLVLRHDAPFYPFKGYQWCCTTKKIVRDQVQQLVGNEPTTSWSQVCWPCCGAWLQLSPRNA